MIEMFRRANEHQGASFVEVYQNCNVFNDGAFDTILNKDARPDMLIDLKHGEPIRFGAERELGVVMNEFGEATIVRRRRRRRGPAPRARRAPRRPVARVRAVAPGRPADDADAGRRVPRRRPADVRGRDAAAAGRGVRRSGARRPRRRCSAPRRPGRSAEPTRPRPRSVERAEDHAGARLRARRTSSSAACARGRPRRRGSARRTPGEHRIAALAAPLSTSAATPRASWR